MLKLISGSCDKQRTKSDLFFYIYLSFASVRRVGKVSACSGRFSSEMKGVLQRNEGTEARNRV